MRAGREPSERLRVYLDTSVFSAYLDERTPERQALTRGFWLRLPEFEPSTSVVAERELARTPDVDRRSALLELLAGVTVYAVTPEIGTLAVEYIGLGIVDLERANDAMHVASAVLTEQDVLVSWNFRHLVNRRRRALFEDANRAWGLPLIEILSPPEV